MKLMMTPHDIQMEIAQNVKKKRKSLHLTQLELSKRAAVSYGSIKRFETKGEISLSSLIRIAYVLDCADELMELFKRKEYSSIQEVIDENS